MVLAPCNKVIKEKTGVWLYFGVGNVDMKLARNLSLQVEK